ncbi:hypothetical protein HTZ97_07325 [Desulfuromonas acetoxidans]|uniref:hypothetical protein n=1 Tax=Desulfuromonas acetoxidans TaxID=891 RepID=UPI0005915BCF|nr:hypothetical protein [Desulfuromonas acetoxidans]MBF0644499.1 hypothetical protein [Desulfuromonas acetoxidans]NVD23974.1 hypothetical protein [Desulfuromonas acetoxidans]NVE16271.1 hypothetical protein [Desulfuromonas acetoxidans]
MRSRSYGRPICDKNRLGLALASPSHCFFLHADKLIALRAAPGEFRLIKRRNKHPEKAIGYHPGGILGRLDIGKTGWVRICLFLGECGQNIELDGNGGLLNVLREYHHVLRLSELDTFMDSLTLVIRQREQFAEAESLFDSLPFRGLLGKSQGHGLE